MPVTVGGLVVSRPYHHGALIAWTGGNIHDVLTVQESMRQDGKTNVIASLLIQQGANPKYIQEQLGHGSIQVTMDIYGHLFAGDHRHMVSRLDDPQDAGTKLAESVVESATHAQPAGLGERANAS
jgi:hypothetical protein